MNCKNTYGALYPEMVINKAQTYTYTKKIQALCFIHQFRSKIHEDKLTSSIELLQMIANGINENDKLLRIYVKTFHNYYKIESTHRYCVMPPLL